MDKVFTIQEIEAEFESEWVLIEEPTTNDALEVQRGKVIHHSRDRDEVYRVATSRRPKHFAVIYTGKLPKDTAIAL